MKAEEIFEKGSVWKAIARMSIPAMVTMVVMILYNMADMFFVGKLGDPMQIAAISLVTPVFGILMSFGTLIGGGGCAAIAKAIGNREMERARACSGHCAILAVISGVLFTIAVLLFANPILNLLGVDEATREYTRQYLTALVLGAPFILFANAFANVVRAEGAVKESMIGNGIATLCNLILDPIFILGLNMGVAGAAIATVIGNMAGCVYLVRYCIKKSGSLSLSPKAAFRMPKAVFVVLALGIPSAAANLMTSVTSTFQNHLLVSYGSETIAAMGVGGKAAMIVAMLAMGICIGVQPLIAYNYGAGNVKRTKEIVLKTGLVSTVVCVLVTSGCYIFRETIVSLFVSDPEIVAFGVRVAGIQLLSCSLFGLYYLCTNFLQAAGNVVSSVAMSVMRQGLLFLPALYLFHFLLGLNGIIYAAVAADVLATAAGVALCIKEYRKFRQAGRQPEAVERVEAGQGTEAEKQMEAGREMEAKRQLEAEKQIEAGKQAETGTEIRRAI